MSSSGDIFSRLTEIGSRPKPFEFYTAHELWTDEHTSEQMLRFHLNQEVDLSSRNLAFIDRSVEWIVSRFKVGCGTDVADFGCGPGLYAIRLADAQANILGVDFSPSSIRYAKEQARSKEYLIQYEVADYLEFESDRRFQLILLIMCDFCALSPAQRSSLLDKFYTLLVPGGSLLLDVYSLAMFEQKEERAEYGENLLNGFWSSNQYFGFLNSFKYEDEKLTLDKYTIVEKERTRTIYNWLQCFSPESLESELDQSKFKVKEILGNVAGDCYAPESSEFAVIATKL